MESCSVQHAVIWSGELLTCLSMFSLLMLGWVGPQSSGTEMDLKVGSYVTNLHEIALNIYVQGWGSRYFATLFAVKLVIAYVFTLIAELVKSHLVWSGGIRSHVIDPEVNIPVRGRPQSFWESIPKQTALWSPQSKQALGQSSGNVSIRVWLSKSQTLNLLQSNVKYIIYGKNMAHLQFCLEKTVDQKWPGKCQARGNVEKIHSSDKLFTEQPDEIQKICFKFVVRHVGDSATMWTLLLWSDTAKIDLFDLGTKC